MVKPLESQLQWPCSAIWRFPKIGEVPQVIIHSSGIFPYKNHPAMGVAPFSELESSTLRCAVRIVFATDFKGWILLELLILNHRFSVTGCWFQAQQDETIHILTLTIYHLRVGQPPASNQIKFHVNLAVLSDPAASHRLLKSLSTLLQSPPRSLSSDPFFMPVEETLP